MNKRIGLLGACAFLVGCQSVDAPPIGLSSPVGLVASNCEVHPQNNTIERALFHSSPNSNQHVDVYIRSGDTRTRTLDLTLENYWCRFDNARHTYASRAGRAHNILVAQNAITFGAGAYIGSTLALNSSGLNDTQTDDLLETAVGIGLMSASRSLYDPLDRRTRYRNASLAAICYMSHIDMAYNRQRNLTDMSRHIDDLQAQINAADSELIALARLLATNQDELQTRLENLDLSQAASLNTVLETQETAQQVITDALTKLTQARTQLSLARQQQAAALTFERTLREDAMHFPVMVQHSVQTGQLDLQTVVHAIRDVMTSAREFTNPEEVIQHAPDTGRGNTGTESSRRARSSNDDELNTQATEIQKQVIDLNTKLSSLEGLSEGLASLIPNFTTITTSMRNCRTVLMTGQRIEPDLSDFPLGSEDTALIMELQAHAREALLQTQQQRRVAIAAASQARDALQRTTGSASVAETSANTARVNAESVVTFSNQAQASADNAETSAQRAEQSAETAQRASQNARQSAEDANDAARNAETAAARARETRPN